MIPLLQRPLRNTLVYACVCLFFLPKINILSIQGQTAGLRIDDLVIFASLAIILVGFALRGRGRISKLEWACLLFIVFGVVSALFNIIAYGRSNVLYALRILEYFTFFYIGYYFAIRGSIQRLSWILLFVTAAVMLLQYVGLLGGFASSGFRTSVESRVIGLAGGPWEVGAIINILFGIIIFGRSRAVSTVLLLFVATFVLIFLTGARLPTVAHIILLLYYFYRRSRDPLVFAVKAIIFVSLISAALLLIPNPVVERSSGLTSSENVTVFKEAYRGVDLNSPPGRYEYFLSGQDIDADASWLMRAIKWATAIRFWQDSPSAWLVGLGPGFMGIALDGGWLRVLVETGFVGLALFLSVYWQLRKLHNAVVNSACVSLAISMIAIDIHMAYKVMALFFFVMGYFFYHGEATRQRPAA
ncbi:MAG: hypothetical protein QHC78_13935 [Pigmentiphaga sp.]|uniref:hypothetical protein n=1 Tax=Pigmentiphaga sp. TaxID=1977564 RepID=UPI0029B15909|nr:hypothetical protein [Pigmentiphaga sp.]MDX3906781.1 hypothetical protein [Pigmentiphaga sp.]